MSPLKLLLIFLLRMNPLSPWDPTLPLGHPWQLPSCAKHCPLRHLWILTCAENIVKNKSCLLHSVYNLEVKGFIYLYVVEMTKEQAADLMAPLDLEESYRLNPRPLHQLSGRTGLAL